MQLTKYINISKILGKMFWKLESGEEISVVTDHEKNRDVFTDANYLCYEVPPCNDNGLKGECSVYNIKKCVVSSPLMLGIRKGIALMGSSSSTFIYISQ
jgi:hypothetical protein